MLLVSILTRNKKNFLEHSVPKTTKDLKKKSTSAKSWTVQHKRKLLEEQVSDGCMPHVSWNPPTAD